MGERPNREYLGPLFGATDQLYDPPAGLLDDTYYRVVVTSALNGQSCSEVTNTILVQVNPFHSLKSHRIRCFVPEMIPV